MGLLVAGDFEDAALGGQIALEDHVPAGGFEGVFEIPDDHLARRLGRFRRFFGDGPTRNG